MANFVLRRTDSRSILGPDPDGFGFGLLESRTEGMSAPKLVERPLYGMRSPETEPSAPVHYPPPCDRSPRKSRSQPTRRWRKPDSNH
jgi:hypothetical protein